MGVVQGQERSGLWWSPTGLTIVARLVQGGSDVGRAMQGEVNHDVGG
jgi:hypothetical protein